VTPPGLIVVLNGAPRSGKSSIAAAIQRRFEGVWMNLGVDVFVRGVTPERYRPGIGLRPGGERPDLEHLVPVLYAALYESVAAHSRLGLNVVVDVGHHEGHSRPLGILPDVARRLAGLPAYLVGVRCPIEEIMRRRDAGPADGYVTSTPNGGVPEPVRRWQRAVHVPGVYDLEVDTSVATPDECAEAIRARLRSTRPPTAFDRIYVMSD
jgi:chloramphenicol 3-O phosphotransferase